MQPVHSTGKHAIGTKRRKTCNRCQVRENTQPVPRAGKHTKMRQALESMEPDTKRGKTCNRYQAGENTQPVPRAGKHTKMHQARKHATRHQAQKNRQPEPSVEKQAIITRRRKNGANFNAYRYLLFENFFSQTIIYTPGPGRSKHDQANPGLVSMFNPVL